MFQKTRTLFETNLSLDSTDQSSWDFHYRNLLHSMSGTLQEKQDIIRKRILRYFGEFKMQEQNFFCIRNDPDLTDPSCTIIPNQLILYGADYFSINRALQYFAGYFVEVKRIDDSHLLVGFQDQKECLDAVNKKKDRSRDSQVHSSSVEVMRHFCSSHGWFVINGYKQFIFERQLMARYVTSSDKVQESKLLTSKNSLFFAYSEAKRKFIKDLQDNSGLNNSRKSSFVEASTSRGERRNSHSRSRSREHRKRPQQFRCCCQHGNNRGSRFSRRDDMREDCRTAGRGNRSDSSESRSSNYSLQRSHRKPAMLEQMRTQQTDSRFDEYLKKRSQCNKKTLSGGYPSRKDLMQTSPSSRMMETSPSHRMMQTSSSRIDLELDLPCLQNQNQNDTLRQFEEVLQRMRLEDSRQQYSAFEIDEEDLT